MMNEANEPNKPERLLEGIIRRQRRLEAEVGRLGEDIRRLASRRDAEEWGRPGDGGRVRPLAEPGGWVESADSSVPPPLPVHLPSGASGVTRPVVPGGDDAGSRLDEGVGRGGVGAVGKAVAREEAGGGKPAAGESVLESGAAAPSRAAAAEGFELKLGRVWLVRMGVFLLLTGLVFLANYGYQHLITDLGPLAKSMLLYAGSGMLAVAGVLVRRRERLERFGQVLEAGGLAAVFYTTFASYHVEALRWLPNPHVAGALLLGWTAFMAWRAERLKSQLLAAFSLLLAYYSLAISPIGWHSLAVNLLLVVVAVFFLLRNRWIALSTMAFLATYGMFSAWRIAYPAMAGEWAEDALVPSLGFLGCYWLVFFAAMLLAKGGPALGEGFRAGWSVLNHIAFYTLGAILLEREGVDILPEWSAGFGAFLLGCAYAGVRVRALDGKVAKAHLVLGLGMGTLGLIGMASSEMLPLLLGFESFALLLASRFLWSRWHRAASVAAGALAVVAVYIDASSPASETVWTSALLAGLFAGQAIWQTRQGEKGRGEGASSAAYSMLSLLPGLLAVHLQWNGAAAIAVAGVAACALPAALPWHRCRSLAVSALGYTMLAQILWIAAASQTAGGAWQPSLALAVPVSILGLLWYCLDVCRSQALRHGVLAWLSLAEAVALVTLVFVLAPPHAVPLWLALLAMVLVAKARQSGPAWSAVAGQLVAWLGVGCATVFLFADHPWWAGLPALAGLAGTRALNALSWKTRRNTSGQGDVTVWRGAGSAATLLNANLGVLFLAVWTLEHVGTPWISAFYASLALAATASAYVVQKRWNAGAGFFFGGMAVLGLLFQADARVQAASWLAYAALLATQAMLARYRKPPLRIADWLPALCAMTLVPLGWWLAHRSMTALGAEEFATIGWTLFAFLLFPTGMILRERVYRIGGLLVLAGTLLRLVFVDLWELGSLVRILSFLSLGAVLVAIGYCYNRFSDSWRKFLG